MHRQFIFASGGAPNNIVHAVAAASRDNTNGVLMARGRHSCRSTLANYGMGARGAVVSSRSYQSVKITTDAGMPLVAANSLALPSRRIESIVQQAEDFHDAEHAPK